MDPGSGSGIDLRAVATGALIALSGVLVGSAEGIPAEGKIVAAVILAVLAVALGLDTRRKAN